MDCTEAKSILGQFSLIHECDVIGNGALRMSVPFQNTDGSNIDLFLKKEDNGKWILSDLGNTTAYLLDMHVKPWTTKNRLQIIADICTSLGIAQNQGQFQTVLSEAELIAKLPQAIVRLSQACIRISDLAFTRRLRTPDIFNENVEEFLGVAGLNFEERVLLLGQFGKPVEVDFQVSGKSVVSLIQTLSTGNSAAAHSISNEVFRRWYDLGNHRPKHQFLTVYDTSNNNFKEEDLKRMSTQSSIFGFPAEHDQIKQALAA
jgi:hypothetical protein